jgi:hypothetical protein
MSVVHSRVVVIGAGSAGCVAALASARAGIETLLIERLPFLGGTSTAVLDTFYAFYTAGENPLKVVSGVPDEPVEALRARGKVRERPNSFGSGTGLTYDPESLKLVWSELLRSAGVRILLHAMVVDVNEVDGRVNAMTVATKAGLITVRADVFVDASGDADVVHLAGSPMQTDTDLTQPCTLTFRMGSVDVERFAKEGRPRLRELLTAGRAAGLRLPGEGGSLHVSGAKDTVLTALTRVAAPRMDDPFEWTRVELESQEQIQDWIDFLVEHVPGCEGAELSAIGTMAGIRETRRIQGESTLSESDVINGEYPTDTVALCGAPIEDLSEPRTRWQHVGGSGYYGIPMGVLMPVALENVLVAGRCVSAEHGAHASARSMATCMALGQAAGTLAALSVTESRATRDVSVSTVQDTLVSEGATIEVS